jgi:16S rRNA (cytosine967-C5)-methyltransferase
LKWRQDEAAIAELGVKQAAILAAAATLVRPGGRLVYATCSLLQEENDDVVSAFLAAHPDFAPLNAAEILSRQGIALGDEDALRLLPHVHGSDGFFAVAMERKK